eukprot:TRINITY_DN18868_c0_g1_i1.p1 TRINITY_DN18868_c0_g1~~TRINITY_DN18868_c0_g1_i1.p1  ORF type:complete len:300 (-),score=32.74 TRINITY_DN18868_c0_g1_i1:1-879(-)
MPASLWTKVVEKTQTALKSGALHPIRTKAVAALDSGAPLVLRVPVHDFPVKPISPTRAEEQSPFLPPYHPDLHVGDISATHVCFLNKYCVSEHHVVLATREFEEQGCSLTVQDFQAAQLLLQAYDSLVFYNSGPLAGASQRHKHLQAVPLPLVPELSDLPHVPITPLLPAVGPLGVLQGEPFPHVRIEIKDASAYALYAAFTDIMSLLRSTPRTSGPCLVSTPVTFTGQFNLLLTRRWMMVVPRAAAEWTDLTINALGFAGTILLRTHKQLEAVKLAGPAALLRVVSGAAPI